MKRFSDIGGVKSSVKQLLGKEIVLNMNRGRNKVKRYTGVLSEAHENVFVVQLKNALFDRISCTYTDILCGDVVIAKKQ